jgi:hypothetical protein
MRSGNRAAEVAPGQARKAAAARDRRDYRRGRVHDFVIEKLRVLSSSVDRGMTPTCTNIGGRGRYRSADRGMSLTAREKRRPERPGDGLWPGEKASSLAASQPALIVRALLGRTAPARRVRGG